MSARCCVIRENENAIRNFRQWLCFPIVIRISMKQTKKKEQKVKEKKEEENLCLSIKRVRLNLPASMRLKRNDLYKSSRKAKKKTKWNRIWEYVRYTIIYCHSQSSADIIIPDRLEQKRERVGISLCCPPRNICIYLLSMLRSCGNHERHDEFGGKFYWCMYDLERCLTVQAHLST